VGEAIKATVEVELFDKKYHIRNEILQQCKKRLSLYKIPQEFEFVDKIVF